MLARFFAFAALSLSLQACSSAEPRVVANDAGTDAEVVPPPADNAAFFESLAAPTCERIFHCCATKDERDGILLFLMVDSSPTDVASCTTAVGSRLRELSGIMAPSLAAGRLQFVPTEAAKCLADVRAAADRCDGLIVDGAPASLACPSAYLPKVALGGECLMSAECTEGVCQPTDASRTKGVCQPRGKEGQPCIGQDSCETGLVCSQLVGGVCDDGKAGTCQKKAAHGTRCCSGDECLSGECWGVGDAEPTCGDPLPTTPAPETCTGK